jgi:DNA repair protein RecN (Recombination protein N)
MLVCLRVRNLAIIDELEVTLGPGLNVVTGETGAGKSILVDALNLVLGAKGKPEVVRTGEDSAEVEALFELPDDPSWKARLDEKGLGDADEIIIRRVVQANGRSRAYINGRLASAAELVELAAGLCDISSQHEHHTLVDPQTHLAYLDAYGQLGAERAAMAAASDEAQAAHRALTELEERVRGRGEREDLLRFQIREIDELDPRPGESAALLAERERLRHAEKLARAAGGAEDALYAGDEALCEAIGRVAHEVRSAAAIDARLAASADQIEGALAQLEDAARELGRYARHVEIDPARLTEVEERIDRLKRLERKYGGDVEAVLAHRAQAAEELADLEHHEERVEALRAARDRALEEARGLALTLRKRRTEAASRLGALISEELATLGMGGARVEVAMAPLEGRGAELAVDGARLSPTGIDRAEFLIAPNRGEEARPLRKVASGGELSRSLLAIKRVLAGLGPAGLYVFDEVDTGVGGAVAEVIGQKLRDVARHSQVLCITHLPQIAVYGDRHFRVQKDVVDGRTRSAIEALSEVERLAEIARMLGGVKITAATRAAASEMMALARA